MNQMKISNKAGAISSNIELWKDIINSESASGASNEIEDLGHVLLGENKQDIGRLTDTKK